ncbi:cytochrome P450, family 721, subfamily A, polypeptide 1 [Hibiscus trionum]|uniref:Cytochrome P450, family 721, subfamily A, polypeptide 1 n=1 Tax=Hibiscus trionum TaxID=183268 RepID=A0A9W7IVT0_HIBTR|nr:cytochrome P450, family 721, subfamily A, polypeptide 1 [Hibiscus trionum]
MIIDETLRLYLPIVMLMRKAYKDVKLGNIDIPAGTELYLALAAVYHDTGVWGNDAHKFNPTRFKESRKHLASFIPYGLGPRFCVGQTLATVEMKTILAMIIRRYCLVVSSAYVHAPKLFISLEPQYGVQIVFTRTTL